MQGQERRSRKGGPGGERRLLWQEGQATEPPLVIGWGFILDIYVQCVFR